jgi:hypothetical protein
MKKYYLPDALSARVSWIQNFDIKLPNYAAKYGISTAEMADVHQSAVGLAFYVGYASQISEYSKKMNTFKVELASGSIGVLSIPVVPPMGTPPALPLAGIFKRVASVVSKIKNHLQYSISDGLDLGIEGIERAKVDKNVVKPVISVRIITDGHPEIIWTKGGHDGVEIQVDKGNNIWQFLGIDLKPNFTDTSALPPTGSTELRRYRAIYIEDDHHIGLWSDVAEISVIGT